MKKVTSIRSLALFTALGLSLSLAACSSDDSGSNGDGDGDGGTSGDGDGDGDGGANQGSDPVYAVVSQVFAETGTSSYIVLTDDLLGADLDLSDGIEISGRALGAAPDESGVIYIGTDANAVVTRYELQEDGSLKKTGEVDFAAAGLTAISEYAGQFQFVSEEKAYFIDGSTGAVVVWNPKEMTYIKKIDLSSLIHDGELLSFGAYPVRSGDKIFAFPGWRTDAGMATAPIDRAAVVSIDTSDDTADIIEDDRCPYVRDGFLADDGYVYMATEAWGSAMAYVNNAVTKPCMLRFEVSSESFDDSFKVELNSLIADSDGVGSLVTGPDNTAFIMSLDATDYAGPPAGRPLASAKVWNWATLTVGETPSASLIDGVAPSGGSQLPFVAGDEMFLPILDGQAATDFQEFKKTGPGEMGANITGLAFSTVKLK